MSKKFKIYECETREFGEGKVMKKLVIQGEGDKYPMKNVALWDNHPLFSTIEAGQEHELVIEEKDSKTVNPHGGFYKNRQVLNEASPTPQGLEAKVEGHEKRISALEGKKPSDAIEYPEEDVNPEDVPF